jgi:hypothetical protein
LVLLENGRLAIDDPSILTVSNMVLAGIAHPSRGVSVMCCTGAHLVLLAKGTYVAYGERAQAYRGKVLFRKAARMVFWAIIWKLRSKRGRNVVDFSDVSLEQGGPS